MDISFYEMATRLVGEVPNTLNWLYDLTTVFLIISAFCIFIIPVSIIFRKFVR